MKPRVLCLRPRDDFVKLGVLPPEALSVIYLDPAGPSLEEQIRGAEAMVIPAVGPALEAGLFESAKLRLVQVTGAGVDRVDAAALARNGIALANVPGGSADAVAEYVVATASALLRRLPSSSKAIRSGDYSGFRSRIIASGLNEFGGLTVGIVGLGVIGRSVAERCLALGANVVHFDPAAGGLAGTEAISLGKLLEAADIVTLHVPLIDATRNLIGRTEMAMMKPSAILVNASRGGVVDEDGLADALTRGKLAGAVVDVYSTEPPAMNNPLLNLPQDAAERVILTPHIAGVTRQAWARLFLAAWDNVEAVLIRGEEPRNVVNLKTQQFP